MRKIITKSVIDTLTGKVESVETMDYDGPVAECKTGAAAQGRRAAQRFLRAGNAGARRALTRATRRELAGRSARFVRGFQAGSRPTLQRAVRRGTTTQRRIAAATRTTRRRARRR